MLKLLLDFIIEGSVFDKSGSILLFFYVTFFMISYDL
jgi:hypothetical protein